MRHSSATWQAPTPGARAAAYDALARSYWRPVYAYVRIRWRRSPEDAQDLTQAFFARIFERAYLKVYDPEKARFRRYDLDDDSDRPTYMTLARETGLAVTDVTNELAWARRAFRTIVLNLLREVCATDDEFRTEARDLLRLDPR